MDKKVYIVKKSYDGEEHSYVATVLTGEPIETVGTSTAGKVLSVTEVPRAVELVRDMLALQIEMWSKSSAFEACFDTEMDNIQDFIQDAAICVDEPVGSPIDIIRQQDQLLAITNQILAENSLRKLRPETYKP